jgi:hypothetical protein
VRHHHAFHRTCSGTLEITGESVIFHANDGRDSFELAGSDVTDFESSSEGDLDIRFRAGGKAYHFTGDANAARAYAAAGSPQPR